MKFLSWIFTIISCIIFVLISILSNPFALILLPFSALVLFFLYTFFPVIFWIALIITISQMIVILTSPNNVDEKEV